VYILTHWLSMLKHLKIWWYLQNVWSTT